MRFLALLLVLAACSSPSPRFMGLAPAEMEIDGWRIDVYADGERAQAIRLTRGLGATPAMMRDRGRRAVALATGCRLDGRTVKADANVLNAKLICDGAPDASLAGG